MLAQIHAFVKWLRRRNPQARTWRDYATDLKQFAEVVGDRSPDQVTLHDVDRFVSSQAQHGFKPSTINRRLAAIQSLYDFLADEDPNLICPVLPHRHGLKEPKRLPRPVERTELARFFAVIHDARDRAMFILMLRCGMRIGEVAELRLADLYLHEPSPRLVARGKGSRERSVYLPPQAERALRTYLAERSAVPCDYVFLSYQADGLSTTAIHKRLVHYRSEARVDLTAHRLRHSFANDLLSADVPVTSIQKLLGHRWLGTTQGYVSANDRELHWSYYLDGMPEWLAQHVQRYVVHRRRTWRIEQVYECSLSLVAPLTRPLRWMAKNGSLESLKEITPTLWFAYADARLAAGINPVTLNGELGCVSGFLRFLEEQGETLHPRVLEIEPLKVPSRLPRDLPVDQLQRLLNEIERDAVSSHVGVRRMGQMDLAWFLLMLHSGLRLGEVRRLKLADLIFSERKVRIEQSKGLKDRTVYLSGPTMQALEKYLKIRGPAGVGEGYVFLYRHAPLSRSYVSQRLCTYAERCGVKATPHQLRHSCATLLLNAGAPILTIQSILGHKHVDTTLGYARLYDGTVAADYCRAMAQVEQRLESDGDAADPAPSVGELIALVDSLRTGTLSESQQQVVQALRSGILGLKAHKRPTASHAGRKSPTSGGNGAQSIRE